MLQIKCEASCSGEPVWMREQLKVASTVVKVATFKGMAAAGKIFKCEPRKSLWTAHLYLKLQKITDIKEYTEEHVFVRKISFCIINLISAFEIIYFYSIWHAI